MIIRAPSFTTQLYLNICRFLDTFVPCVFHYFPFVAFGVRSPFDFNIRRFKQAFVTNCFHLFPRLPQLWQILPSTNDKLICCVAPGTHVQKRKNNIICFRPHVCRRPAVVAIMYFLFSCTMHRVPVRVGISTFVPTLPVFLGMCVCLLKRVGHVHIIAGL